ncbi:hypothetical protein ACJX0J_019327, partial [Zea mays]
LTIFVFFMINVPSERALLLDFAGSLMYIYGLMQFTIFFLVQGPVNAAQGIGGFFKESSLKIAQKKKDDPAGIIEQVVVVSTYSEYTYSAVVPCCPYALNMPNLGSDKNSTDRFREWRILELQAGQHILYKMSDFCCQRIEAKDVLGQQIPSKGFARFSRVGRILAGLLL